MFTPAESFTVACTVCGELGVTVAVVAPLTAREMLAGGQVEKYPAAEVTSEEAAETMVEPGRLAVAVPFGFEVVVEVPVTGLVLVGLVVLLMVTTLLLLAAY